MTSRFLNPEEVTRMMELASKPYRPAEIRKLQEEIEGETRAAELRASINGVVDEKDVQKIVAMKVELDNLYGRWIAGEID